MKKLILLLLLFARGYAQTCTLTTPVITNLGTTTATASWTKGAGVVGMTFQVYTMPGRVLFYSNFSSFQTLYNISGLSANTNYRVVVDATCFPSASVYDSVNFTTRSTNIIYTPMTAAGYQFKYLKADSGLAPPFRDTAAGRGVVRAGLIVCNSSDNKLYAYNGTYWELIQGVQSAAAKVDSVTLHIDTLKYWINGVSYGYKIPYTLTDVVANGNVAGGTIIMDGNDIESVNTMTAENIVINNSSILYKDVEIFSNDSDAVTLSAPLAQRGDSVLTRVTGTNHLGIKAVSDLVGEGWLKTGNAGTTAWTNFIGTTDAVPVIVSSNNSPVFYGFNHYTARIIANMGDVGDLHNGCALNVDDSLKIASVANDANTIKFGVNTISPVTTFQVVGTSTMQSINPVTDSAYDLGDNTHRWKDLYLTGSSIHLGNTKLTDSGYTGATSAGKVLTISTAGKATWLVPSSSTIDSTIWQTKFRTDSMRTALYIAINSNTASIAGKINTADSGTAFITPTNLRNGTYTLANKTFIAPALGIPASGVMTNVTGTASGLTAGNATTLETARTIRGVSFNGSANIDFAIGDTALTSGTTFTTPSNITTSTVFEIELVGGGGGGGGVNVTNAKAGAGGAGGALKAWVTNLSPSTAYTYAIGSNGTGGNNTGGNGTDGTNTTITFNGYTLTGNKGIGGLGGAQGASGTGGTATNGQINITGQDGSSSPSASGVVAGFGLG